MGRGGLHELFGEETRTRHMPSWSSVFTTPEALIGIEWLEAAAYGATVFEFENGEHMFTTRDEPTQLMPGFKYVLLPLMRLIIAGDFLPSQEQVMSESPVAYLKSGFQDVKRGDGMFSSLYGPRYDSGKEWLPYSGRYGRIPFLPSSPPTPTRSSRNNRAG